MTTLVFIIPVRHQDNAADWSQLTAKLRTTAASIAGQQKGGDWRAIVVANHGAELPALPNGFEVERVDFPANVHYDLGSGNRDQALDAFRIDKGRRVLMGMLRARDAGYYMIVDDDDFVSSRIARYVEQNKGANGWIIERGFVWGEGSRLLVVENRFNRRCGTSLVVRSDLYNLPERFSDASHEFMATMLGGHYGIKERFVQRGTPLAVLPFRGAVYRVGSSGSHSKTPGLSRELLNMAKAGHVRKLVTHLSKVRSLSRAKRREFFAETA
jgi:hypothetical protein